MIDLEDVLNEFSASDPDPTRKLSEWIKKYPQLEQELLEYSIGYTIMNSPPQGTKINIPDENKLVEKGMEIVNGLL